MRRVTLIAMLITLALAPGRAHAHKPSLIPQRERVYLARSADCGAKGFLGLRSRSYATVTRWYIIEPLGTDCPPPPPGYRGREHFSGLANLCMLIGRRIRHDPPHCITQCFNGGPVCSCCDHSTPRCGRGRGVGSTRRWPKAA